jgi:signal transduction histidine kinase
VGYLLMKGRKSRSTWLFCGWLGGMTFMTASQCAARVVYLPRASAYLDWWGGVGGVSLAMIALVQFAYHFPRPRYAREARVALGVSLAVTTVLFGWMLWETLTAPLVHATATLNPETAFAKESAWLTYNFTQFSFGFVEHGDEHGLVSFKFFDVWQILGNAWILVVWVRKTVDFSPFPDAPPLGRRVVRALRRPQTSDARLSRAWVLLMLLAPLPVVASALEAYHALPPGTFATVHLLVLFVIVLTYINYAPEPTTFMVKLVGISLVTLLVILGLVAGYSMRAYRATYAQTRRAELRHIRTLLEEGRDDALPPDVLYLAERPRGGLFASDYRMITARPTAPDAASLGAHDQFLREGLLRNHYPARIAIRHENPWLGLEGVNALQGDAGRIDSLRIPENTVAYRGSSSRPGEHTMRYIFTRGDTLYEVGYSYPDYRRALQKAALPMVALFLTTTVTILVIFPRFFHLGLVAPLTRLLTGVDRVNRGDLSVRVPVGLEDEIGRLTLAFNDMVNSLSTSEEQLRALNLTLEQRVLDRTRDLTTLYDVAALVGQTDALDELLSAALDRVVPAVGGCGGVVLLQGDEGNALCLQTSHALPTELVPAIVAAPAWETVRESQEALLIHDLTTDPRASHLFPHPTLYPTLVGVPIRGQDGVLGILGLLGDTPLLFNVEDLGLLGTVAEQLGVAIENARLRERAEAAIVMEERQRLSRDLHDSVTQLLYSQVLFANAATKSLHAGEGERTAQYLERLGAAAERALREMRLMIHRLRPAALAELGLAGALQRRLEMVEQRAGIATSFTNTAPRKLPTELEQALYHISEEALNNALKHAQATRVRVELRREDGEIALRVEDNGCGFDTSSVTTGLGLQSLRERAAAVDGALTIETQPGEGTCISARLPWPTTRVG